MSVAKNVRSLVSLLMLLSVGCEPAVDEAQNDEFALGLFYSNTDQHWDKGITNITFLKLPSDTRLLSSDRLDARVLETVTETNQESVDELIQCFKHGTAKVPQRSISREYEWHVVIYSTRHGRAHVILKETEDPALFVAELTKDGSSAFVGGCITNYLKHE